MASAGDTAQATDFKRVAEKKYPSIKQRATAETRYWRKFNFPITVKGHASINAINFCPTKPFDFAVSSSTRVQVFASNTNKVKKTIARFKDVVYSGHMREDGQLLVAGDESGLVQIFNLSSREILRTYNDHLRPVHLTRFTSFTQVMTGSDDTTVRCIDVPSQSMTAKMVGHTDYVRTGVPNPANTDVWLSGSYDHTVKLWDIRSQECTINMEHGAPVESVLMFPSGSLAISAGGNTIKIWDLLAGGRLLHSFSNHQKAITCLAFDGEGKRLLSGSIDHHVKIYNVTNYKVVHGIKYSAPVLSMAMSPNNTHLVVGMANGTLSIRHKPAQAATAALVFQSAAAAPRGGSYKYFVRGKNSKAGADDFRVEVQRKKKLKPYDQFLKRFQYGNALDAALATKKAPIIVAVIEELRHRGGLQIALSGRDETSLEPLLNFLIKNAINPRYAHVLLDVCTMVFDIYAPVLGQSMEIDELVVKLHRKVVQELEFQKRMFELLGTLDMILSSAH